MKVHIFIVTQHLIDPRKWVIPKKFQGRFYIAKTMIGMDPIIRVGIKKKRSRSSTNTVVVSH